MFLSCSFLTVFFHSIPSTYATSSSNTFSVTTGTDDCARRITPSYISLTMEFFAGRYTDSAIYKYGAAARFNNINIPKGSTITAAYLNLTARISISMLAGYFYAKLRGETSDNATTFSTASNFDARGFTTNYTDYPYGSAWSWTKDQVYKSPDFSNVIYEITSRAGWVSGNSLVIFWDDFDARTTLDNYVPDAYQYDENSTGCPKLYVSWTLPIYPPSVNNLGVDSTENNYASKMYGNWTAYTGTTLSFYIFGCNITGSWINDSTTAFSGQTWVNVSKTSSLSVGYVVQWEQWANSSTNDWENSGLQNWTVTATITFQFTGFGTIERNGTSISNGTATTYSVQTNLSMSALSTANYTLLTWNCSYAFSTSNPYVFVVVNQTALWCYFWDSGTWNYSQGLSHGGTAFIYAKFTINDTAPYQNQDTVFFNASLSNSSTLPLAYYWEFGDTNISTGETTTHIYLFSGIFIVNLTVVNGSMSDMMLQNITVFATSIQITFDWNDLLFGSGAWLPFIAIMIAMFIGVAYNKWFIVAAFPIMSLMSFLYFNHITTTPALVWEALIMICSAIVLLIYSASRK